MDLHDFVTMAVERAMSNTLAVSSDTGADEGAPARASCLIDKFSGARLQARFHISSYKLIAISGIPLNRWSRNRDRRQSQPRPLHQSPASD